MTQRLADEQANVSLFAFGVGRGVDKVLFDWVVNAYQPCGTCQRLLGHGCLSLGFVPRAPHAMTCESSRMHAQAELVRIIGAACPKEAAESRYTGLMVLDEAPW